MLIARPTAELRCYLPEPVDQANAAWADEVEPLEGRDG